MLVGLLIVLNNASSFSNTSSPLPHEILAFGFKCKPWDWNSWKSNVELYCNTQTACCGWRIAEGLECFTTLVTSIELFLGVFHQKLKAGALPWIFRPLKSVSPFIGNPLYAMIFKGRLKCFEVTGNLAGCWRQVSYPQPNLIGNTPVSLPFPLPLR